MDEPKTEDLEEVIDVPSEDTTLISYPSPVFAAFEIIKWLQNIFRGKPWPMTGKWPRFYLTGMDSIGYPDVGNYNPEGSSYGPGLNCSAMTTDFANAVMPVINGSTSEEANFCVELIELLNPEEVFGNTKKVKQLSSNWLPDETKISETVCTDGQHYVFRPRVNDIPNMIAEIKIVITKVQQFSEFTALVINLKSELKHLGELYKKLEEIKTKKETLDDLIKEDIETMDYGLPWSKMEPEMLKKVLKNYTDYLKNNDANLDFDALKNLGKRVDQFIDLTTEAQQVTEEMNDCVDQIVDIYDKMIVRSSEKELHLYSAVKEVSYKRSYISSLKLGVEGFRNNIKCASVAVFGVTHIFVLKKNSDTRLSPMKTIPFEGNTPFWDIKGEGFDGFRFVE